MPLVWKGSTMSAFHTISTGAIGSSTALMVTSVMCPLPVAARLPYRVTSKALALGWLLAKIWAACCGPIVWLLDGPLPMRKILFNDSMFVDD